MVGGLILGGLVSAILGALIFLLTVRRLRSDYLAIVTVAVAFILWNLIDTYQPLFDGDTGLFNVPQITGSAHISTEGYSAIMRACPLSSWRCSSGSRGGYSGRPSGGCWLHPRGRAGDRRVRPGRLEPQIAAFTIGRFLACIAAGCRSSTSAWSPAAFLPLESFILLAALIVGG